MSRKLTYDTWLCGAAMLIVVVGLVMIYSASAIIAVQKFGASNPYIFLTRQGIFVFAGGALMLMLMHIETRHLADRRVIGALMFITLVALVIALFQRPINGTHRWIVLPHIQMQPSEFAKPVLILFLAYALSRREEKINELISTLLPLAFVIALFAGLILLEPDFGTAATLVLVASGMIFAAGISWRRVALFSTALIPAAVALALGAAYRRDRLF